MYSVFNTLSEYAYFYIYTFLLVFKIVESLQCILSKKEWRTFEGKVYSFGKSIAGKKINDDFCCKGNINLWEKVTKHLSSNFYSRKTFLY